MPGLMDFRQMITNQKSEPKAKKKPGRNSRFCSVRDAIIRKCLARTVPIGKADIIPHIYFQIEVPVNSIMDQLSQNIEDEVSENI
jgi:hypothetical protein